MRDFFRAICFLGALALWILVSSLWLFVLVAGVAAATEAGVVGILFAIVILIVVVLGLMHEWKVLQERLEYCTQGDFQFDIFGIPISSATGALLGKDPGRFFDSLKGLTCEAARGLLAAAEAALAAAQEALDRVMDRRDLLRNRFVTRAAALIATIAAVVLITFTAPWHLAAAIAAVAVATAALIATGAELAALEAEVRMLEGIVAALLTTVNDLRAQVEALCPAAPATPPSTLPQTPPSTSLPGATTRGRA